MSKQFHAETRTNTMSRHLRLRAFRYAWLPLVLPVGLSCEGSEEDGDAGAEAGLPGHGGGGSVQGGGGSVRAGGGSAQSGRPGEVLAGGGTDDGGAAGAASGEAGQGNGGAPEHPLGGESGRNNEAGGVPGNGTAGAGGDAGGAGESGGGGTGGGGEGGAGVAGSAGAAGAGDCGGPVVTTVSGTPGFGRPSQITEGGLSGNAVDGSASVSVQVSLAAPAVLSFRVRVPADNYALCDSGGVAPVPNHAKLVFTAPGVDVVATNSELRDPEWLPVSVRLPAGSAVYYFRGEGISACNQDYPEPWFPNEFPTEAFYVGDLCLRSEEEVQAEAPKPGCPIPESRASASFQLLGSLTPAALQGDSLAGSSALAVSADGAVVVGGSLVARVQRAPIEHPFVWTATGGMRPLRSPQDLVYARSGGATLVSCDGTTAAGGIQEGFVWNAGTNTLVPLEPYGSGAQPIPELMSANGAALFGWSGAEPGTVVRWNASGGATPLLPVDSSNFRPARASGATPDGSAIFTLRPSFDDDTNVLFLWRPEARLPLLEFPPLTLVDISGDGSTLLGFDASGLMRMQHRVWETIPCPSPCSAALSWNGDQVLFGASVWDEEHGARLLATLLQEAGVAAPSVTITNVTGVSADGRVFVGTALVAGRRQAFRAVLPNAIEP